MKNSPNSLKVDLGSHRAPVTALVYPAQSDPIGATIILGHGAGAGQQSAFMVGFARALSERGVDAVTFNFPYIEEKRRIPDRAPVLEACFQSVVHRVRAEVPSACDALFIGGKSMGGRIATQTAAADALLPISGLILLGYPLHPPGKPDQLRDKHLPSVRRPMLFVQGTRDAFGTPAELTPILNQLAPQPTLHVIEGGDHSFKISRRDPAAQQAVYTGVQDAMVAFMTSIKVAAPSPRPRA